MNCTDCDQVFDNQEQLEDHFLGYHFSTLHCPEHDLMFESTEAHEDHLLGYHTNTNEEGEAVKYAQDYLYHCYRNNFCPICDETFGTKSSHLDEHFFNQHQDFYQNDWLPQYGRGTTTTPIQFEIIKSSHSGTIVTYGAKFVEKIKDLKTLFTSTEPTWKQLIRDELTDRKNLKVHLFMSCEFIKENASRTGQFTTFSHAVLGTDQISLLWQLLIGKLDTRVEEYTEEKSGWSLDYVSEFGFVVGTYKPLFGSSYFELPYPLNLKRTLLNIKNDVTTHDGMEKKCFLYSVLAHKKLGGKKYENDKNRARSNTNPLSYVKDKAKFNINDKGIVYPMTIEQIPRFERQNPKIAVTVIGYEGHNEKGDESEDFVDSLNSADVHPSDDIDQHHKSIEKKKNKAKKTYDTLRKNCFLLYNTKEKRDIQVDLLLVIKDDQQHYVLINDLSSFLQNPSTKHGSRHICRNCLQGFYKDETFATHREFCASLQLQQTSFPKADHLYFNKYARTQKVGFRFYADFESFVTQHNELKEIIDKLEYMKHNEETILSSKIIERLEKRKMRLEDIFKTGNIPSTTRASSHNASGYAWICIDYLNKVRYFNVYRTNGEEEDVAAKFVQDISNCRVILKQELDKLQLLSETNMKMTEAEEKKAKKKGICYFCKNRLSEAVDGKVQKVHRHHNHLPPFKFVGLAHQSCNMTARMKKEFPVFFHNGQNYDFKYLIKAIPELKRMNVIENVQVIPLSSEKFMSVIINNDIKFIDSLKFNTSSLEKLTCALKEESVDNFAIVKELFEPKGGDISLLLEKGAYPYSYMNSAERFKETKLPRKEAFFNDLTEEPIDDDTYLNAVKVWKGFKIKNLGEWHNFYCLLDVALLASIMERTRDIIYDKYDLELCHYFSLPMLSFDACLKYSGVKLEYIKDPTLHNFVEQSVRGGYCGPGNLRACHANNPYMQDHYDQSRPTSYIEYIDATNLYGYAMSQPLPVDGIGWVEEEKLSEVLQEALVLPVDADHGYFLQVDIEIPEAMHDYLDCYPPAVTKRVVKEEELCNFQLNLIEDLKESDTIYKTTKLIADLHNKVKYPIHYRLLQLFLQLKCPKTGAQIKVTKIHRAVIFNQRAWMKGFIEKNTLNRNLATSDFEKDFWKLFSNASYGKCLEQKRNRQNVNIVFKKENALNFLRKPTVQTPIPIEEDLSIFVMKKLNVTLDRPILIGISILDISKTVMYDMHYNGIKAKYGDKAKLVYTDTDSLIYHLETEDMYEDNSTNNTWFDPSKYDPEHPLFGKFYGTHNKDVLGRFKDEFPNKIITSIAAPKPKMYGIRAIQMVEDKKTRKRTYEKTFSGKWKMEEVNFKKSKGISKTATRNQVKVDDYWEVLNKSHQTFVTMKAIKSKEHQIYTEVLRKKALNGICNKRWSYSGVNSLAHGHKDIKTMKVVNRK